MKWSLLTFGVQVVGPTSIVCRWLAGAVTPVPNQGQCGSAIVYAVIAALEAAWEISTGHLVPLSVQEITDCIPDVGCNGGLADPAVIYDFVATNGLCSTSSYPYVAKQQQCQMAACTPVIPPGWVTNTTNVKSDDVNAMVDAVATTVVAVLVRAVSQVCVNGVVQLCVTV